MNSSVQKQERSRGTEGANHRTNRVSSIDRLVAAKEIVVACGPGGVGKTTIAASIATMAALKHPGRVLVLTVDPARRLADALGLKSIGNKEVRIDDSVFASVSGDLLGDLSDSVSGDLSGGVSGGVSGDVGVTPRGELWAAMLDTKQSWDALVRRHAPDDQTYEKILANPLYKNISSRFVQSHDYIAMERLFEIHSEGKYDLIVVDTPPTRNALDFLDAPQRLADFFSSRLLRWIIVPYRSRLVNFASKPFYQVADRILGTQFLSDIAEFFILFQSMYDGFVERADSVSRLLMDRRTTFLVVSTLEATPAREAKFFAQELIERKLHLGAVILNKVLPEYFLDRDSKLVAETLKREARALSEEILDEPDTLERIFTEVAESFLNFEMVALRESEQRSELSVSPEVLVSVPYFDTDISDMSGLVQLGEKVWD